MKNRLAVYLIIAISILIFGCESSVKQADETAVLLPLRVKFNGKYGYIDKTGKIIFDPQSDKD